MFMARIADLLAKGHTFSLEFFPPKAEAGWLSLGRAITELEPLRPSFVSVTYGAGGSTRTKTHDLVAWISRQTEIDPMAHLTCQGHTRADINEILLAYVGDGVENILALGGDLPITDDGPVSSDFLHASELVDHILEHRSFSIGVAAHPEIHPRSPDRDSDRRHLADKLGKADFAITQFFFEVDHYLQMVDELDQLGVNKPVIPGIMPIQDLSQITRMASMSGAAVPSWLVERLEKAKDNIDTLRQVGIEIACELSQRLLEVGAPGLHFYTLNKSGSTKDIWFALGLISSPTAATPHV